MSNQAPWSVKGIDPRAREAAREAARRQGLTIGEWLNQAILANEEALAHARYGDDEDDEPARRPATPSGRADPRIADALDRLAERVDVNDRRNALAMLGMDRSLAAVAARVERSETQSRAEDGRVADLLEELRDAQAILARQVNEIEVGGVADERLGAVEADLQSLSARAIAAEQGTTAALVRLDGAMTALDAKLSRAVSPERLDEQSRDLRERFDASLDTMAQDVAAMIAEARADMAGQIVSALGGLQPEEMNAALADMSKRLTAAEKRHTQTIEAVSIEIKRLSESMDRRLRGLEARNDDGAATAELRDDIAALSRTLDQRLEDMSNRTDHRLGEMEAREASAFSRMGEEVGRIAERLDVRVSHSDARSAEAIDKVGEQVALMAERLSAKQDKFAAEVAERIVQSEERQGGRLSQALSAISARLGAIETGSSENDSPVAAAMDAFAARLAAVEARAGTPVTLPATEPPVAPAYLEAPVVHEPPPADLRSMRFALEHEEDLHARADIDVHARHTEPEPPTPSIERILESIVEIDEPAITDREAVFLEDIEEEFARREADPDQQPTFELPTAPPRDPNDPFADIESAPPEDESDLFWSTGKSDERIIEEPAYEPVTLGGDDRGPLSAFGQTLAFDEPTSFNDPRPALSDFALDQDAAHSRREDAELNEFDSSDDLMREALADARRAEDELNQAMFGAALDLEAAPKEDYLATARRAAQANTQPAKKGAIRLPQAENAEPAAGLRGLSRAILWGAAGVMAAAVAGGVYVYSTAKPRQGDFPQQPSKSAAVVAPPGSIAEGAALAAQEEAGLGATGEAPLIDGEQPVRAGPVDLSEQPASYTQPLNGRATTIDEAAAQGDGVAQYEIALGRLAAGDTTRAVPMLRKAANQGLAMAQYRLAKLYERGEGVPLDLVEARRWTERAAVAGNRKAMHDLGVYYARGEGAPFDEGQAFKWFRQAAEYGVGDSQFNLGVLYTQGRGVTADSAEALYWFSIAAGGGDADARARAAMIEQKMDPTTLTRVKDRLGAFRVKSGIARANGDFGPRPWAGASRSMEAAARSAPRS